MNTRSSDIQDKIILKEEHISSHIEVLPKGEPLISIPLTEFLSQKIVEEVERVIKPLEEKLNKFINCNTDDGR